MDITASQIAIFGTLLSFLVVGFMFKKRPKTLKEYALGKGSIPTSALIATMIATAIGGSSVIGYASELHQQGMWLFLVLLAAPISFVILAIFIIPRLSRYYGCFSMAEVVGRMYGQGARKLVGVIACVFCVGTLAAQVKALQWVIGHISGQDASFVFTLLALGVIVLYSTFGGVSSVIKTDVMQCMIFMIIVPAVAYYMIDFSGGISQILASLPKAKSSFLPPNGGIWGCLSLVTLCLLPDDAPWNIHRLLVGRSCRKNQIGVYVLGIVEFLLVLFVGCVGFIAIAKFPNIESKETIFAVVQGVFTYKWVVYLFVVAMIAVIASTADSLINTGAIILTNDVVAREITEKQKLILSKSTTVVSGVVASAIALCFSSVLDIALFFSEYYSVVVTVPFLMGLFLKERRKEAFWASVIVGVGVFSVLHLVYRDLSHEIFLMSSIASVIVYFVTFFITKKYKLQGCNFSLTRFCNNALADTTKNYIVPAILGVLIWLSSFVANIHLGTKALILCSEGIIVVLTGVLFFSDRITSKYKNIFVFGALWGCFAFFPMYLFLTHQSAIYFVGMLVVSISLLAYLLEWIVFVPFLFSASIVSSVMFCALSKISGVSLIAPIMCLELLLSCVAIVAYIFTKRENEKNSTQEALDVFQRSLNAEKKYREVLLKKDTTTSVDFEEFKSDLLEYFQHLAMKQNVQLTIECSLKQKNPCLNTGLPLSAFNKLIFSVLFSALYCTRNEKIIVVLHCHNNNQVKQVRIWHGECSLGNRLRSLNGSNPSIYPKNVVRWGVVEESFKSMGGTIQETPNELVMCFFFPRITSNKYNIGVLGKNSRVFH